MVQILYATYSPTLSVETVYTYARAEHIDYFDAPHTALLFHPLRNHTAYGW